MSGNAPTIARPFKVVNTLGFQGLQIALKSHSGGGMLELRGKLEEGDENELAFRHPRVRKRQIACFDDAIAEEENVDIDRTRPLFPLVGSVPAENMFDFVDF